MPAPHLRRSAALAFATATALALVTAQLVTGRAAAVPAQPTTPAAQGVLAADATRVDLTPGANTARFYAQEVLVGVGANTPVGTTMDVKGQILVDLSGKPLSDQSKITVGLDSLVTDSANRDRFIKRSTLETQTYPTADLTITDVPGLPLPMPSSGTYAFEILGDLTIHGVTRPTTWQANVSFADGGVTGTASTTVLLTDYGMTPPKAGPVISVEDAIRLEIDVSGMVSRSEASALPLAGE